MEGPAAEEEDGLAGLRELQAQLAGTAQSPWQPRCVARAFRTPAASHAFVFTMQAWIDLDAVQSPFLLEELPDPDLGHEAIIRAFEEAFAAFGHTSTTPAECAPFELALLGKSMIRVIRQGFAMRLRMNPPKGMESGGGDDGFGDWLPVMACLKAQLYFGWEEALAMHVERALAVVNAHRRNEGWTPAETPYALRDVSPVSHGGAESGEEQHG
ncbi:MAG: hypothetical protein ABSE62_00500 [Chthoniobacteraceae bacterium]|jgi:hypothetical protein